MRWHGRIGRASTSVSSWHEFGIRLINRVHFFGTGHMSGCLLEDFKHWSFPRRWTNSPENGFHPQTKFKNFNSWTFQRVISRNESFHPPETNSVLVTRKKSGVSFWRPPPLYSNKWTKVVRPIRTWSMMPNLHSFLAFREQMVPRKFFGSHWRHRHSM